MVEEGLNIGTVERDSGIARDTLRVWERRYGFPVPFRNNKGERLYPKDQLRRLQRIRRLLDQGLRPGKVVGLKDVDLEALETTLYPETTLSGPVNHLIDLLQKSGAAELESTLSDICQQQGMETFIKETVVPLLSAVGERWAMGSLQIFEEHLLSEVLTRFLNSKISVFNKTARKPCVLLATMPGEQHTLGLLMLAAVLSSRHISVVNLGGEVPLDQITAAVERFDADVLGVTFSRAYQYEHIRDNLTELRDAISDDVDVWMGGEGAKRLRKLPKGVTKFTSFDELPINCN